MKRKRTDWDRLAPLGLGGRLTIGWIRAGLGISVVFAWIVYASQLSNYQNRLYWSANGERVLRPDAVMEPFYMLLQCAFVGFGTVALCMLPLAVWHYFYHYQDGRSIYLMRRLPSRWELWRRCLAIPLLCLAACVLLTAAHILIFYVIYQLAVPKQCLQPGQWRMLLESLFN